VSRAQDSASAHLPRIFERDYYQRLYETEEHHGWAQGMREAMVVLLRQPFAGDKPLRVLDIGCGTGYLLGYLQRHCPLAGQPVGIDVSSQALGFCRQRGAASLALASAAQIPFASTTFDLIVCIDTLQHLSPAGADRMALEECARLLRPGGWLYLRTNSALGRVPLSGADPGQYRRYRLEIVASMLREVGLAVERATYLNAMPGAWAMLREYVRSRRRAVAPAGPGLQIGPHPRHLAWMNPLIHLVLSFEAWLVGGLGLNLPFGHSAAFVARRPN
jgi:ubiquinone/menaquinone biosynthesis C-methylase UbiE